MNDITLTCENITKSFGKKEVLKGVNLTLEPHKIYGLIGRNGAGKTTLLSILTAQNFADSGIVHLNGEAVWENEKALSHICFSREIPQMLLMGQNTVKAKDYLQLAGYYYPFWDKAYAKALCEEFKIDLKQKICKMNKGMLSMLTIIIALASRSDITILDEPVAGLDVFMRDKFYTLLLKDYAETMRTFIISTHIIEEASNLLEEVIVLNNGVIEEKENTQQLIGEFLYISGKAEDVDNITSGFTVVNSEVLGNLKNVCVRTTETEKLSSLATAHNLDVATVPLQKIFVYLTGEKA